MLTDVATAQIIRDDGGGRNHAPIGEAERMPDLNSLTTLSGVVVCLSTIVLFYRLFTVGAVMLIMDGAGGTAIFWDRWSARAGEQVHVTALASPVPPTSSELAMLLTHLPLAILGLCILGAVTWRRTRASAAGS
jgi:hypothetical protein